MTVQDLIDELQALPRSARTATVVLTDRHGCVEDIDRVCYEHGNVFIDAAQTDDEDWDDIDAQP